MFNNNVGHDAIVKFANTFHAGVGSHLHHWNTNLMILPTPDGASGQVYLVLVDFATKPASIVTSATYADELVKTAQGWRFKKRATKTDVAPAARRRRNSSACDPGSCSARPAPRRRGHEPHPSGQRVRDPRRAASR